jgi:hypothetical protein
MGASMKIGQKKYSERMRPPRPAIDYEPQSANQMRTRPSHALKATFSAELVSKGWPRNGADQTIPQNFPKHISIQAIIPISDRDLARRDQMASPFILDYATIRLRSERGIMVTTARLSGTAVQLIWKAPNLHATASEVSNFGRQLTRSRHQALKFSSEAFVLEKEERMAHGMWRRHGCSL